MYNYNSSFEEAGSEPVVTLRMEGEGVVVENSISLLVDSVSALDLNPHKDRLPTKLSCSIDNRRSECRKFRN